MLSKNNKKLGNEFEVSFCETLFRHGMWVHNMAQNASGQPADVIAVKDGTAYLIDCKVCTYNRFQLSRIEENQHFAMEMWKECGNGAGWFALKCDEETYMLQHQTLVNLSFEKSSINRAEMEIYGVTLDRWLRNIC